MSVWKSDETLLSICILNFSFKNDFVWEEISNIRHSVSSPDETPRSSSKILRCASYFQLSSRCFIWWWNTASHVWYITSQLQLRDMTHSWLLNNYFRLSGFQSSVLLLIHFRYGPWYLFTLHLKRGTEPIRYVTLQFRDLGGAASLRHRNRAKIAVLMCEQKAFPVWFSRRCNVTYSGKFEHSLTN